MKRDIIGERGLCTRLRRAFLGSVAGLAMVACFNIHAAEDDAHYLALGDSVAFGYINLAGYEYLNARNFIGYPAYVGAALQLTTVNAACPGETSGSFMSSTATDDGCRSYRGGAPLHVAYPGTQLAFATGFLKSHPNTRLVTIALGGNDLILLVNGCAVAADPTGCIETGVASVLGGVASNMEAILAALRGSGYSGPLVVVSYYSPDYTDTLTTGAIAALNQTVAAVAGAYGALVADGFGAFELAASSAFAGGHTCMVGLLNASAQNQYLCDKHPSQSGQQLLAQVVENASGLQGR